MDNINILATDGTSLLDHFQYPYFLYIAIPLVILCVVGFFLMSNNAKKRPKNIISLCLHLVMSCTLALAFANYQFDVVDTKSQLIVLVDCSASEKNNIMLTDDSETEAAEAEKVSQVDTIVENLYKAANPNETVDDKGKRSNSTTDVAVVCFAKTPETLVNFGEDLKSVSEIYNAETHPDFDESSTNLETALEYANGLYKENAIKRLVIVSDGQETDGNAINQLQSLLQNNVYIEGYSLKETEGDEVEIAGITYTDHVYKDRDEHLKVTVKTRKTDTITLTLTRNGEIVETKENIQVNRGVNVIDFALDCTQNGDYNYQVSLTGTSDSFTENNTASFKQDVTDSFKVLFVGDSASEQTAFTNLNLYSENTQIDYYLNPENNNEIPHTIGELVEYDEIVLSNVNILTMKNHEEFLDALHSAVKVYGKSLLTFGNTYSDGSESTSVGNYNAMLPVQYETDEVRAIVLLIDVSGSMETDNRISKAKQGAINLVNDEDIMHDADYISIITFSDQAKVVQSLIKLKDNRTKIVNQIRRITSEGGTQITYGLKAAYNQLKNSQADYKEVLTLTDGEPFETESEINKQINTLVKADITCSFINISCSDGQALLKRLAKKGNGKYWYCTTASKLAETMKTAISSELNENKVEEGDYEVTKRTEDDESLLNVSSLPNVTCYSYCRIKKAAVTVLTVPWTDEAGGIASIPLYAHWTYGAGKVASFTSDIATSASAFATSTAGATFFKNVATQILPDRHITSILDMSYEKHGVTSDVYITATNDDHLANVHIVVTDPNGETAEYDLYWDGNYYSGNINTPLVGEYNVNITYTHDTYDEEGNVNGTDTSVSPVDYPLYFDYSAEYEFFGNTENNLLYRLSKTSGSLITDASEYKLLTSETEQTSKFSTMVIFMLISCGIFLVDVFVRKSEFKKNRKVA